MNQKKDQDSKNPKGLFSAFKLGILTMLVCLGTQLTHANLNTNLSNIEIGDGIQSTVTGTVNDTDGNPLPGASVVVKGTTNGTQTDFDGNYSIDVEGDAILVFSYVGFATQEIAVNGQSTINVSLAEDASQLEEVVVLGYTTQTRGDVTGSVASVDMEEALKAPTVNAAEALEGRVTGVRVITNGNPGATPKINIRGFGTSNNTNPLYIIDGVQTDDANVLNNINPADIDQMNVLKDGAAAIYGARASNGVVVITTKSGGYNMDKAKVSLDLYTGFSQIGNTPGMMNAQQHADMMWASWAYQDIAPDHPQYGSGASPVVPSSIIDYRRVVLYDPSPVFNDDARFPPGTYNLTATVTPGGTDWLDAITQTAPVSNISMSVENGSESGKYLISVGYLDREGILLHTGFQRASTRLNSEFKIGDKLRIGEHLNVSFSNTKAGNDEAIEMAFRSSPVLPVYDDAGEFAGSATAGIGNSRNPVAQLYRTRNDYNKRYAVFGDVYASYAILDELTFKTTLAGGFNTFDSRRFTSLDPENGEPISVRTLIEEDQTMYNWSWSNTLNYNKSFGEHSINALVGVEAVKDGNKGKRIDRTGYLFDDPDFYLLSNGSGAANVNYAYDGFNSLYSIFATANYNFKDTYYATATLRQDESSRFLGDNKSDIFPSFSAGWVVSNEAFYPEDAFVSRLKLKGSWGQLGNQTLPVNNPTINISNLSENLGNYAFDGGEITTGAILTQVGNPDLVWETSVTSNFGADLNMLDNKLNVSAEFFTIKTKDLITQDFNLISSTAIDASAPYVNLGDIKNTGVDFSASYSNETEGGFGYSVSANISHYKNEVTNLINDAPVPGRDDLRNGAVTRTEVGEEMSYFYGRNVIGLDDTGRMVFEDVNNDGIVNDEDRTKIGTPHPDFTYGINANFDYKGFDASLFFTGSQGNDVYNYNKVFTDFGLFFNANRSDRLLDAWTPSNTNTDIPALTSSYPLEEASANSYFVEDGSYLRLKNLQIGYTLPESVTDKIGMSSLRIYVQGTNLLTITGYEGFDPEVIAYDNLSLGIDRRIYPVSKIFTLGANIKF